MAWIKTSDPQLTLSELRDAHESAKLSTEMSHGYMRRVLDMLLHILGQLGLISGESNAPTNRIREKE